MSQFWQNLQVRLQPAVPKDSTGVPGRKWFSGFFSIGSMQNPEDRPYVVSTIRLSCRPRTKHRPRWPSCSLQKRGQTSHWMRPSGKACQWRAGKTAPSISLSMPLLLLRAFWPVRGTPMFRSYTHAGGNRRDRHPLAGRRRNLLSRRTRCPGTPAHAVPVGGRQPASEPRRSRAQGDHRSACGICVFRPYRRKGLCPSCRRARPDYAGGADRPLTLRRLQGHGGRYRRGLGDADRHRGTGHRDDRAPAPVAGRGRTGGCLHPRTRFGSPRSFPATRPGLVSPDPDCRRRHAARIGRGPVRRGLGRAGDPDRCLHRPVALSGLRCLPGHRPAHRRSDRALRHRRHRLHRRLRPGADPRPAAGGPAAGHDDRAARPAQFRRHRGAARPGGGVWRLGFVRTGAAGGGQRAGCGRGGRGHLDRNCPPVDRDGAGQRGAGALRHRSRSAAVAGAARRGLRDLAPPRGAARLYRLAGRLASAHRGRGPARLQRRLQGPALPAAVPR